MSQNSILEGLKKELAEQKEQNKIVDIVKEKEQPVFKKKKKKKKNKTKEENKQVVENLSEELKEKELNEYNFKKFKEDFMSNETKKKFINSTLASYRGQGYTQLSDDDYLLLKMKHPALKAFVIHPSYEDLQVGRTGVVYFIKPLYMEEENDYLTRYPDKRTNMEVYVKYCLQKCTIYPGLTDLDVETMPAGRSIAMFNVIKEMSDLTKRYELVEI